MDTNKKQPQISPVQALLDMYKISRKAAVEGDVHDYLKDCLKVLNEVIIGFSNLQKERDEASTKLDTPVKDEETEVVE